MKIKGHKFVAEDFREYIEPERLKDIRSDVKKLSESFRGGNVFLSVARAMAILWRDGSRGMP